MILVEFSNLTFALRGRRYRDSNVKFIPLADTGLCVGQVGINHGPLFPEKELGWFLYDGHEGKGYASEAAMALRDWAFATFGLSTLVSYIEPDNSASVAVARRLGAVLDPAATKHDPTDLVYRHVAPSLAKPDA